MTHFQGTNPALHARWNDDLKLFEEGQPGSQGAGGEHAAYPLPFSGYMQVGRVSASRTNAVRVGEIVGMTYGHKSGHTADPARELVYWLPALVDPALGIYVAQMGPICANGVLHADEEAFGEAAQTFGCGVRGKNVLVCGSGVIGLMLGMLCRWAGAAEVGVAGRSPFKLEAARKAGLLPIDTTQTDVGTWCKMRWHDGENNRGAHVAFQCSGSDELLSHALRSLQPQGAVIDLGFYLGGAPGVHFGREFHHNGLKHICAQIYRVPKKLRGSWDRRRLAHESLAFLQSEGRTVRDVLFMHTFPFDDAQHAFDLVAGQGGKKALQVLLKCE